MKLYLYAKRLLYLCIYLYFVVKLTNNKAELSNNTRTSQNSLLSRLGKLITIQAPQYNTH